MSELRELQDPSVFFNYGRGDIDLEIESDFLLGIMQPQRTMFYNRADGCGLAGRENYPSAATLKFRGPFDVVSWVGFKNTECGDGTNGTKDRRIAISQTSVKIEIDGKGNVNVEALYIPFKDVKTTGQVSVTV